jgi:ribosomal protein L37AE/L43A
MVQELHVRDRRRAACLCCVLRRTSKRLRRRGIANCEECLSGRAGVVWHVYHSAGYSSDMQDAVGTPNSWLGLTSFH